MSYKTRIIEEIFRSRWNEETRTIERRVVSLGDVQLAIEAHNRTQDSKTISTRNPANFFKDLIRNQQRANKNWPPAVLEAGFTGQQLQSEGNCFEYIPLKAGQTVAFPSDLLPLPDGNTPRLRVESVSIPLASKRLGRKDEPWLIQVLVKLRIFETHLAISSNQRVVQIDHLQTNIKLRDAEIDALFLATMIRKGEVPLEAIVCCEAKGRRDDIVPHQILNQVRAAFKMNIEQSVVIPMAVKAIAPSEIWVVEFEPVERDNLGRTESLTVATSAIYELVPPVPGIGQ